MTVPRPSVFLRLVAFAVPAALAMAGLQPLLAAAAGAIDVRWALGLAAPAVAVALLIFGAARVADPGDSAQPPWYSAWLLLPGAFFLAGAAGMCVLGALSQLALINSAMWALLLAGSLSWSAGLVLVRRGSR
ncbi:MAG: hypothetical protein ACHQ0J_00990 [Candidatus Dormibacterales bacterium]